MSILISKKESVSVCVYAVYCGAQGDSLLFLLYQLISVIFFL